MEHLPDSAGPRKSIILIGGISVPVPEGKWGDWNDILKLSMPLGTPGIDGCFKCGGKECGGRRRCLRILRYVADCIENVPEVTRPEITSCELSDQGRPGPDLSPVNGVRDRTRRLYQQTASTRVCEAVDAGHLRVVLQGPTGSGKTEMALTIIRKLARIDGRVIFVVPFLSLIDQTVERFMAEGVEDLGVIQADHRLTNPDARIQIASVQTLMYRPIPPADLVIIDECHRWFVFYERWMARTEWARVPFIGLSATPWTRGLGKYFLKLIVAATISELIDQRYLTPFRVFAPTSPDLRGVRTIAGDYHEGDLARVMDDQQLVGDIVGTWKRLAEERPTFCFCVDRALAKHMQERFEVAGVGAAYIDAATSMADREKILRQLHEGTVKVVCSVGTLTTGVDRDVRCIILARPTKSEMLFVQMVGRGLRPADGKTDLLILDHSTNHARLGFVTDIHHAALDDGEPRPRQEPSKPLPSQCPKCAYLKRPQVWECPNCGYAPPRSLPEMLPGRLEEIEQPKVDGKEAYFCRELKWHAETATSRDGWR